MSYELIVFISYNFLVVKEKRMLERDFQASLIKELKILFPGCVVMKNDPTYIQGIPDLLILYKNHWAALECKKSSRAARQPNQEYYVDLLDSMSFAAFIFPENKEEILDELQRSFKTYRKARAIKS